MGNERKRFLGFTMLEILTVVVVIAFLVALAFPVFKKTIEKSREKIAITNLKLILAGENLYRLSYDHYYYPPEGTSDLVSNLNQVLNLDIEPRYFSYVIEPEGKYNFKIYALKEGERIYSIDQEGVLTYLKE